MTNIFENKRVLVTGATGLIGSNLVNRLLSIGVGHVIAIGRNKSKLDRVFGSEVPNLSLIQHEVTEPLPESLGTLDYIFHAAGPIGGKAIKETPVDVALSNIKGTINCLDYLRKQKEAGNIGIFIGFSSASVANYISDIDMSIDESQTELTNSLDAVYAPYTESKRMVEVLAKSYYRQYGIPVLLTRFSYVYGYSASMPETAFFEFVKNSVEFKDIIMTNPVDEKRDNIYIDDAIDSLLKVCENGQYGESYNISSNGHLGNFASMIDIANCIVKIHNEKNPQRKMKLILQKEPVFKPGIRMDNHKAMAVGGGIKVSITQGITAVLERMRT